jgi:hypothetical protein
MPAPPRLPWRDLSQAWFGKRSVHPGFANDNCKPRLQCRPAPNPAGGVCVGSGIGACNVQNGGVECAAGFGCKLGVEYERYGSPGMCAPAGSSGTACTLGAINDSCAPGFGCGLAPGLSSWGVNERVVGVCSKLGSLNAPCGDAMECDAGADLFCDLDKRGYCKYKSYSDNIACGKFEKPCPGRTLCTEIGYTGKQVLRCVKPRELYESCVDRNGNYMPCISTLTCKRIANATGATVCVEPR